MARSAGANTVTMAGQRPAYAVVPPALTRHVLFRIPHDFQPHNPETSDEQQELWKGLLAPINGYLKALYGVFKKAEPRRFRVNLDDGLGGVRGADRFDLVLASETLLCELQSPDSQMHMPRIRIRVDVHSEHVTLTHIVDHIHPESMLGQRLSVLDPADVEGFYTRYWDRDFLPTKRGKRGKSLDDLLFNMGGPFAKPYAEFRGVVCGLGAPSLFQKPGSEPFVIGDAEGPVFRAKGLTENVVSFAREHRDFLWALVRSEDLGESNRGAAMTEAVVCGMLDGRALYASPLADRPGIVRYLAAYDGLSASQLGRFVRRLHTLGELRLNALLDLAAGGRHAFNKDGKANPEYSIRRIGQQIRRLSKRVDEALCNEPDKGVTAEHISELSRQHTEASQTIDAGVIHRVERSHNYVSALERRIADLRLVHIEGWQSYDAFVRRYHSQDHDYIAGVGRRYRALGQRIDRLMFLHQSRASENYQTTLTKAVTNIEKLQERAEDIAVLAVIYYGAASISYLGGEGFAHNVKQIGAVAAIAMIIDTLFLERRLRSLIILLFRLIGWLISFPLIAIDYSVHILDKRSRKPLKNIRKWRGSLVRRLFRVMPHKRRKPPPKDL